VRGSKTVLRGCFTSALSARPARWGRNSGDAKPSAARSSRPRVTSCLYPSTAPPPSRRPLVFAPPPCRPDAPDAFSLHPDRGWMCARSPKGNREEVKLRRAHARGIRPWKSRTNGTGRRGGGRGVDSLRIIIVLLNHCTWTANGPSGRNSQRFPAGIINFPMTTLALSIDYSKSYYARGTGVRSSRTSVRGREREDTRKRETLSETRRASCKMRARRGRLERILPVQEEALGTRRRGVASSSRLVLRTRPPERASERACERACKKNDVARERRAKSGGAQTGVCLVKFSRKGRRRGPFSNGGPTSERDRDLLMAAMTSSRYSESTLDSAATQVATRSGVEDVLETLNISRSGIPNRRV